MSLKKSIEASLVELEQKSLQQIQVETAIKWAGRACAAAMLDRHDEAHEFAHEAIEHAALSNDDRLLKQIRLAFVRYGVEG